VGDWLLNPRSITSKPLPPPSLLLSDLKETAMHNGRVSTYRDDGSLLQEVSYENGVPHGAYRDYWSNGRLSCEGEYVRGVQHGEWRYYNPDGGLREVIRFEGGREVVDWNAVLREKKDGTDLNGTVT